MAGPGPVAGVPDFTENFGHPDFLGKTSVPLILLMTSMHPMTVDVGNQHPVLPTPRWEVSNVYRGQSEQNIPASGVAPCMERGSICFSPHNTTSACPSLESIVFQNVVFLLIV